MMKNKMLISRTWFTPALILFVIGAVMGLFTFYGDWQLSWLSISHSDHSMFSSADHNLTNEVALSFVLIGLITMCFAETKNEDEYVYHHRLLSWQWSVLINYSMLFLANWIFYDVAFFSVMMFSMVSILLIFLIRFYFVLYNLRHHEE